MSMYETEAYEGQFEGGQYEQEYAGEVFGELNENELAAELLEITNEQELEEFLGGSPLLKLACLRPDGWPYVIPLWFSWFPQSSAHSPARNSRAGRSRRSYRRNPRAAVPAPMRPRRCEQR